VSGCDRLDLTPRERQEREYDLAARLVVAWVSTGAAGDAERVAGVYADLAEAVVSRHYPEAP